MIGIALIMSSKIDSLTTNATRWIFGNRKKTSRIVLIG